MDRAKLNKLIKKKRERNLYLNTQIKYLDKVEQELSKTKLKRFFSTSYLVVKRFILLLVSLFLIFVGLFVIIDTSWVYENTNIDEYLTKDIQKEYQKMAGKTLEKSLYDLSVNEPNLTSESVFRSIANGFNKTIEDEVYNVIIGLSVLLIIIGFLLLYIARLTKKIRLRNKQISLAEEKIENVLCELKNIISSEEDELKDLEDIYDYKIVGDSK